VSKNSFFVQTHWEIGGAENVFLDWLKNFRNNYKGNIINIAESNSIHDKGKLYQSFQSYSNKQYNLKTLGNNPLAKLLSAWNLILLYKPELIYIYHQPYFYILTPFIKKYLPSCTIIDILHVEDNENPGYFEIADEYKNYIDKRVVISEYWKEVLIKRYKEEEAKINVVYNNIDVTKFKPFIYSKSQIYAKNNLSPEVKKIGFIGRLNSQKRPMLFLKLAEMFADKKEFHFFMMGDGELKAEIEKQTSQMPNFSLFQANPNPQWFYDFCDVMIFPSLFEGFPMVSLECAAMNTPFIASNIVGFKEQVEMGNIGKLIDFGNDEFVLSHIEELLLNEWDQLIDMGSKGERFINSYLNQLNIPELQIKTLLSNSES
jgi:glycosyltransferase involved in cell wall biosynthesis